VSELTRLVGLAELLVKQKSKVADLEDQLKAAKADAFRTEREDLPELMSEVGMSEFVLEDGSKVSVKEEVDASITEAKRDAAVAWLVDNGFGGLIKTTVTASFAKGDREAAVELAERMSQDGIIAELKEVVHPATLKSFVKEQLTNGEEIPFDTFSIRPYNIANISPAKGK